MPNAVRKKGNVAKIKIIELLKYLAYFNTFLNNFAKSLFWQRKRQNPIRNININN
jgi:hypothetical protein